MQLIIFYIMYFYLWEKGKCYAEDKLHAVLAIYNITQSIYFQVLPTNLSVMSPTGLSTGKDQPSSPQIT